MTKTPTKEWTIIEQRPQDAALAARAIANGAPAESTGPGKPGWYLVSQDGDVVGPLDLQRIADQHQAPPA